MSCDVVMSGMSNGNTTMRWTICMSVGHHLPQVVDRELKTATTVSGLLEKTLLYLPDHVLDASPVRWTEGDDLPPVHTALALPPPVSREWPLTSQRRQAEEEAGRMEQSAMAA